MRHVLTAAFLALAAPATADEAAIRGVIDDQIAALRADDFAGAFGYASPAIRGLFGTPSDFGRMVVEGYPMVHRPAAVEYLGARPEGRGWSQEVLMTDAAGRLHVLRYSMVETEAGWLIDGVRILDAPEVGA